MANNEHIQSIASEFNGDEERLIKKIGGEGVPNFKASEEFKKKLNSKLQDKIILTQQQRQEQAQLDAVPKKLKWRFYLTGYGYAIVSFVVLFLIGFFTNIFTGTLKVPTKYTYLEESKAFGTLNRGGDLAYSYNLDRASNFIYDATEYDNQEDDYEYEEAAVESSSKSTNSLSKIIETQTLGTNMATTKSLTTIDNDLGEGDFSTSRDYILNDGFTYNKTYRFSYKNKLFPKLNLQYPVYKSSGVLMGLNTPNQVIKNLKIGNVSFKNFQDLDIMSLEMEQSTENGYNIVFDNRNAKLYFYPNGSREASEYLGKLPSNKQILKNVEKDLKKLGVSLKNYGEGTVDIENFDDSMGIIQIFYPFLIQGKFVRYAEGNSMVGMHVAYDLNLQKIVSIVGIDIATYDVSNYPTLDKDVIESKIEQGGEYYNQGALHEDSTVILFDGMEVVYIEKMLNGEIIYVPTIRATVSTSLEDYIGPSVVYKEIV